MTFLHPEELNIWLEKLICTVHCDACQSVLCRNYFGKYTIASYIISRYWDYDVGISHTKYQGWCDDAWCQCISSHGIDLVFQEYSGLDISRIDHFIDQKVIQSAFKTLSVILGIVARVSLFEVHMRKNCFVRLFNDYFSSNRYPYRELYPIL